MSIKNIGLLTVGLVFGLNTVSPLSVYAKPKNPNKGKTGCINPNKKNDYQKKAEREARRRSGGSTKPKKEVVKVPPKKNIPPVVQVPKDFKPKLPKVDIDLASHFKREPTFERSKLGNVSVEVTESKSPAKKVGVPKAKKVAGTSQSVARKPASSGVASSGGKTFKLKTPKGDVELSADEYKDYQANPAKYRRMYGG